jgi:hypothetical protein
MTPTDFITKNRSNGHSLLDQPKKQLSARVRFPAIEPEGVFVPGNGLNMAPRVIMKTLMMKLTSHPTGKVIPLIKTVRNHR